jgi:hypothetical protein
MADASRRFRPPWHVDTIPGGYVVRDANGRALAPGPDAAATLAAKIRGDTPRDAAGGCAGKTTRAYTVDIGHADGQAG